MNGAWSFYLPESGVFSGRQFHGGLDYLLPNTPSGYVAWPGAVNHLTHKLNDARTALVAYTPPPMPDAVLASIARADRDRKLSACDWVVSRAIDRSEPVPPSWAAYRQALRDVTSQEGFPHAIEWPSPPT